jgi:hypothetical protein
VWLAVDAGEADRAGRLAKALAPYGVACVTLAAQGASRQQVVASWRSLMRLAGSHGLPLPDVLGGGQRGGALATAVPLLPGDGLRGRIVIDAPLGARSLPTAWPEAEAVDRLALLSAERAEWLLVQAEHDPAVRREDALELCRKVLAVRTGVHPVELADCSSADVWAGLGGADDLLLPLLRAFVLP